MFSLARNARPNCLEKGKTFFDLILLTNEFLFIFISDAFSCYALLSNRLTLAIRENVKRYYDCYLVCDDPSCAKRTMQISLKGLSCLERGCRGRLKQEYDEFALYNQLKYFEALFDVPHYVAKKGLAKDE